MRKSERWKNGSETAETDKMGKAMDECKTIDESSETVNSLFVSK